MDNRADVQELKNRSLKGMAALFSRQFLVKIISFLSNVVLARFLVPEVFGIYAIVSFVIQFFSTFGDVGLGAALVQKKRELTTEELSSTFWMQQIIVFLIAIIIMAAAPVALVVYRTLPPSGVWLIRGLAVSFMLSSLKTVPAILLERELDFKHIAWVDITENLIFQFTAISMAISGYGVWSFIIAAILRSLAGTLLIYYFVKWIPKFILRWKELRELMQFGIPFQGTTILSFIKDALVPLFVGAYAGATAVGYINWARSLAFTPLMFSESFGRVAFPAFSKIQNDKVMLGQAVERSIRMMTFVLVPVTAVMLALGPEITRIVFTEKWMPGIWAFYLYCTSPIVSGVYLPIYSAILALGNSQSVFRMTLGLMFLEWGMGIPFVIKFGFTGVALNQPIVGLIFYFVYTRTLKAGGVKINVFKNVKWQIAISLLVFLVVKLIASSIEVNLLALGILIVVGLVVFTFVMYLLNRGVFTEFTSYLLQVSGLKRLRRRNEQELC